MEIPEQFRGRWTGTVYDSERAAPYHGEIVLTAGGGSTRYDMARSAPTGVLSQPVVTGDTLMLHEPISNSCPGGPLKLQINQPGESEAVWREGQSYTSRATMTRAI